MNVQQNVAHPTYVFRWSRPLRTWIIKRSRSVSIAWHPFVWVLRKGWRWYTVESSWLSFAVATSVILAVILYAVIIPITNAWFS